MKIAFGLIVKNLNNDVNIIEFLKNAGKFNHVIDEVIIAYSHEVDLRLVEQIEKMTTLKLIKINHAHELENDLRDYGLTSEEIKRLIFSKNFVKYGLIPYGKNRNNVLIQAIVDQMDILFFIDDDVSPTILSKDQDNFIRAEIDFVGEHLRYLKDKTYATTSDYSGYYIIPPMDFENIEYLIRGLQKGELFQKSLLRSDGNLTLQSSDRNIKRTNKILGGNVAFRLEIFNDILPFFSDVYTYNDKAFLTRGEDTLLGLEIDKLKNQYFLDIDLKIFHDTFGNFPKAPNILKEKKIKDRFYYACAGWIGRNPFLNWLLDRDIKDCYTRTRKNLLIGTPYLARYLEDERFYQLPELLNSSYKNLEHMMINYFILRNTWKSFLDKIGGI